MPDKRVLATRPQQPPDGAVFSPETPGYEEWLRRQAQPAKSEIGNRKSKI